MSIKDQIKSSDGFTFGLWNECPDDAPVAWGARAISDSGCGFSLLHDRQSWAGPKDLIDAFSKVLNQGPIKHAIEVAKRLRDGWTPYKELSDKAFREYWFKKLKDEPELFESWAAAGNNSWLSTPDDMTGPRRPYYETPKDADPIRILHACQREVRILAEYEKKYEDMVSQGKDIPVPDPPDRCENEYDEAEGEGEDCGQDFVFSRARGEWDGCHWDCDAWVCDNCGFHNYVDEDEDDEWTQPKTPVIDAYQKILGTQRAQMTSHESGLFTLYDDGFIVIKANTNGSHGYVYIIAYAKHDVIDAEAVRPPSEKPEFNEDGSPKSAPDDVFWSGPRPIPVVGERVNIIRPDVGRALVIGYRVVHNYLHLITIPESELPKWWHEQNEGNFTPPSRTWNVAGVEISKEEMEEAS